ncbi:hypothetical protein Nos7524_1497 [Nostoc sp. PCC 7524]|nr:hypothetical protein Nos7524_1497 [Nostoc sp. PCC 7524]
MINHIYTNCYAENVNCCELKSAGVLDPQI